MYNIIKNISECENLIYQTVFKLLDNNRIYKRYKSICPICDETNLHDYEYVKVKCSYCKETYFSEEIEEVFKVNI